MHRNLGKETAPIHNPPGQYQINVDHLTQRKMGYLVCIEHIESGRVSDLRRLCLETDLLLG